MEPHAPCRTCGTTDPSDFYETQGTRYCRAHHNERYFQSGRTRLLNAKLHRKSCVDCGLEVTPENAFLFDFDHLHSKERCLSQMTTASLDAFERELAKCELVCANDHRLRTRRRGRTWAAPGRPRKLLRTENNERQILPGPSSVSVGDSGTD